MNSRECNIARSLQLQHGKNWIVAGMSGCGKSRWVERLINNLQLFDKVPKRVMWCYGVWQNRYETLLSKVEFHNGIPNLDTVTDLAGKDESSMLILDDLMEDIPGSSFVQALFTKYSHHLGMTVIIMTQNLFVQGKIMRTLSLNTHYIVLFKNPRDSGQLQHLARQLEPSRVAGVVAAFKACTRQPYTYFLIDNNSTTDDDLRYRTNIFPGEVMTIYKPQ